MVNSDFYSSQSSSDSSDQSYDVDPKLKYTPIIQTKLKQAQKLVSQITQIENNSVQPILTNPFISPLVPYFNPTINYYFQVSNLQPCYNFSFTVNQNLRSLIQNLETILSQAEAKIGMCKWIPKKLIQTKKRRTAVQITKQFKCPYENCFKFYGSDVSLNLHIKIKHKGGNKTDRDKLARQICQAQLSGLTPPAMTFQFPPKFLESYRATYYLKSKMAENTNAQ